VQIQGGTFLKPGNFHESSTCRRISEILARVGDKWTVLVIIQLRDGSLRFSEIKRRLGSISQKMLTTTLRALERDGFLTRTVYPTVPPRVEYALTGLGRDLLQPVAAMASWATANADAIDNARARFDGAAKAPAESAAA
jgi:DNA-binding HxlR family transcriptional regulator